MPVQAMNKQHDAARGTTGPVWDEEHKTASESPSPVRQLTQGWKKKMILFIGAVVTTLGGIIYGCLHDKSDREIPQAVPTQKEFTYTNFVEQWNTEAEKYSHTYTMLGRQRASDAAVRSTLISLLAPFSDKPSPAFYEQLAQFDSKIENVFHEFEKFRRAYRRDNPLVLQDTMNEAELAKAVNEYVRADDMGTYPSYVFGDTVKHLAMMDNICVYFKERKKRLHTAGIAKGITECRGLETNGIYPELDALVRHGLGNGR